jgi:DNA-binding beta-propeller fold protein YncE
VGTAPVAVDMDKTTGRAFVVNQGSNTVSVLDTRTTGSVLDLKTGTLLRSVAVGQSPIAVVISTNSPSTL